MIQYTLACQSAFEEAARTIELALLIKCEAEQVSGLGSAPHELAIRRLRALQGGSSDVLRGRGIGASQANLRLFTKQLNKTKPQATLPGQVNTGTHRALRVLAVALRTCQAGLNQVQQAQMFYGAGMNDPGVSCLQGRSRSRQVPQ